jgi:hypothetical protein
MDVENPSSTVFGQNYNEFKFDGWGNFVNITNDF